MKKDKVIKAWALISGLPFLPSDIFTTQKQAEKFIPAWFRITGRTYKATPVEIKILKRRPERRGE